MKKIAVFDLDGTVYTHTLTFAVAEELMEAPEYAAQKRDVDKARIVWKSRGSAESYWTYNKAMLTAFEHILPNITQDQLRDAVRSTLEKKGMFRYAYTTALIKKYKDEGRLLVAISGSIQDIVEPFAKDCGFDVTVASELEYADGKYTGKRVTDTKKNKDALLRAIVEEHGATLEDSVGVGDTHRDISMLSAVAHPIAFNPNAALYNEAAKQGWKIVIERKNMMYELEGQAEAYVAHAHPAFPGETQEHLR